VSEVIDRAGGFKFTASIRHITLKRASDNKIIPVDLTKFFMLGDKDANPYVNGGDVVNVPSLNEDDFIEILGDVVEPDKFEYREDDSLSTLVKYAHGFMPSAKLDSVEIVRFSGNHAGIERWFIDITKWRDRLYSGVQLPGDIKLESGDRVYVRNKSDWEDDKYVTLKGEVNHPGIYAIKEGTTRIKDVLDMAGGLSKDASIENAILFRTQEEKVEDKQLRRLQTIPYSEMSETEYQYFQARILEQKGVMAIDFKKVFTDSKGYDNALLFDKDSIFIPRQKYYVNVQGRVITPGLVAYRENYTYLNYIDAAGGFAYRADDDETFIHKARGEQFLAKDMNYTIEPGDNILVPPQKPSTFWKDINTSLQITVSLLGIVVVILSSLSQIKK
jgi:protein involved in polysaccharide export with SLBB domain